MDEEKEFLLLVRKFKSIGYGRMMQIISHEWHDQFGTDALTVGNRVWMLSETGREDYERLKKGDPLFKDACHNCL